MNYSLFYVIQCLLNFVNNIFNFFLVETAFEFLDSAIACLSITESTFDSLESPDCQLIIEQFFIVISYSSL